MNAHICVINSKQMSPKSDYIFLWPKKQESDKWMSELGKVCGPSFHYELDLSTTTPTEQREPVSFTESLSIELITPKARTTLTSSYFTNSIAYRTHTRTIAIGKQSRHS